jgi:hypothetical protein
MLCATALTRGALFAEYDAIRRDLSLFAAAFAQEIRQARNHPTGEWMHRRRELLLVLSSCFVASAALQPFVHQHLESAVLEQVPSIAQFCCLHFCHIQTHLRQTGPEFVNQIPNHVLECSFTTGSSFHELM